MNLLIFKLYGELDINLMRKTKMKSYETKFSQLNSLLMCYVHCSGGIGHGGFCRGHEFKSPRQDIVLLVLFHVGYRGASRFLSLTFFGVI